MIWSAYDVNRTMTNGQTAELIALFAKKVSLDMPESVAQRWIENPAKFAGVIDGALMPPAVVSSDTSSVISDWQDFYQKFFGLAVDLSGVRVPEGLERTVYIAMGISINAAVKAHRDRNIPFWKYCDGDLESVIQKSERGPVAASYAIRVKSGQEADEDLKNRSAEMIAEQNINTENLLERLVHGLKYYDETGKHLDVKNVTLCASSRFSYGSVPFVCRHDDGSVDVHWYSPRPRYARLRARRAVR